MIISTPLGALDLHPGTDELFYITKQVNDLRNFNNRQSDYSRQFTVPLTTTNRTALGLMTNEPTQNAAIECSVMVDDIPLINKGKLIILAYNDDQAEIYIMSGNYDLFGNIPDKSIKELDLSAYGFNWSIAGLDTINTNTSGSTVLMVEFFDEKTVLNPDGNLFIPVAPWRAIDHFAFAFYLKTIFKEICLAAGYTVDDSTMTSDLNYADAVVMCPVNIQTPLLHVDYAKANRTGSNFTYNGWTSLGVSVPVQFNNEVSDAAGLWTNYKFTIDHVDTFTFKADINFNYDRASGGTLVFTIRKNGGVIAAAPVYTSDQTNTHLTLTITVACAINDLITFEVQASYVNSTVFDVVDIITDSYFELSQTGAEEAPAILPQDYLPDMSQRDFCNAFLSLYNAAVSADTLTRIATIKKYTSLIAETPQDWSAYMDMNYPVKNELFMGNLYQASKMEYSNDELERTDTAYTVDFSINKVLELAGNILNIPFSASDESGFIGMYYPATIPFYSMSWKAVKNFSCASTATSFDFQDDEDFEPGDWIYDGEDFHRIHTVTDKKNGNLYIGFDSTVTDIDVSIVRITFNDQSPRILRIDRADDYDYKLAVHVFGLNYQTALAAYRGIFDMTMTSLYNTYYKKLFDALRTTKVITCYMVFSPLVFYKIDMLKPVYIQQLNGTFYINKIDQWKANRPCLVELIRTNIL